MKKIILVALAIYGILTVLSAIAAIPSCLESMEPRIELLASSDKAVVGNTVKVTARGYGGVDSDKIEVSIKDNQCGAVLDGNSLKAEKEGICVVTATYEDYSDTVTVTFTYPEIQIKNTNVEARIGERFELTYDFSPSVQLPTTSDLVTYTVDAEKAKLEQVDGKWYLIPLIDGSISVSATYKNGNISFSDDLAGSVTTKALNFTIGLVQEPAARYLDIPLKITSAEFPEFDETKVTFVTDTEGVTIEGNVIKGSDKELIHVWATYDYLGVTVKSAILEITTETSAIPVNKPEDLEQLRDSDGTFLLFSDIDLSAIQNWEPINGFSGTFYGYGHKITGINLSVGHGQENMGLFGLNEGTITDLSVVGTVTSSGESQYIGILCGNNRGTIRNSSASGVINAPYCNYVGGVIGHCDTSYVSGLTSNVQVTGRQYVGGVIGNLVLTRSASYIAQNLTNYGEVHGEHETGGVIGACWVQGQGSNEDVLIRKLTNHGSVIGTENRTGGVLGYACGSTMLTVSECKNTGAVTGRDEVGGIVGYIDGQVADFTQAENTADVSGNLYVGGYVGVSNSATMRSLKNAATITGKAYVGGIVGLGRVVYECENTGSIRVQGYHLDTDGNKLSHVGGIGGRVTRIMACINHADLDVSAGGLYVGGIAGSVIAIRSEGDPNSKNKNYGEIKGPSYVGGIAGELVLNDGANNHTVALEDNVNEANVMGTDAYVGGLIGYVCGDHAYHSWTDYYAYVRVASSKNTGDVSGTDFVGGLFGDAPKYVSEIAMCENTGDVKGNDNVGGYVGRASGTTMRLLTNNQTITGRTFVGGIAGEAGTFDECVNNGTLVITGYRLDDETPISYVGGIAGYATSGVKNCVNNAEIDASNGGWYVGGIVGLLYATRSDTNTILRNKNYGDVYGVCYVGGIAGHMYVYDGGSNVTIEVKENVNEGVVSATSTHVGGIVGYAQGKHSYVSWTNYYAYVKFLDCKNTADVIGADYVGGIAGYCGAYVEASEAFWDTNAFEGSIECAGENRGDKYAHIG